MKRNLYRAIPGIITMFVLVSCNSGSAKTGSANTNENETAVQQTGPESTSEMKVWKVPNVEEGAEAYFSPDGKSLIFNGKQGDDKTHFVYTVNIDGTSLKKINDKGEDACSYYHPEGGSFFMSDNETIILRAWKRSDEGQRGLPMTLFTVKDDGSELSPLTDDDGTNWAPFPSPDGKKIAYVKVLPPHNYEIFLRELETGKEVQLTHSEAFDGFPAISPDGKMLSFSSSRGAAEGERKLTLYLMDISSVTL